MLSHQKRDDLLSLPENSPIIIVGAGIAGLTLSLALARHGQRSIVLEARDQPITDGAGIQLGPNATVLLDRLGVLNAVKRSATQPEAVVVRALATGKFICELPLVDKRHNGASAPYLVVHRADLHKALKNAAEAESEIQFRFGWQLIDVEQQGRQVVARCENERQIEGQAVVGCDGLWSRARQVIAPDFELKYAGLIAARAVVPMANAPSDLRDSNTGVWLGPEAHIVKYPIDCGGSIALVVVTSNPQRLVGWGHDLEPYELLRRVPPRAPDLSALLQSATSWRQWALYDPEPLASWSKGQTIVIGDAAHPILPFLAQGGAMAIEDAFCLADCMTESNPQEAFAAFELLRRDRVARVQIESRKNGQIYHLSGIPAVARDTAMRLLPRSQLMRRYDWIYSWRPQSMASGS